MKLVYCLLLTLGLLACGDLINQQETIPYPCPKYADLKDAGDLAATEVGEPDSGSRDLFATDGLPEGETGDSPWVGTACEADEDCGEAGRVCVTKEFLATMGLEDPNLDVPGGMCSRLFCASDADCGPEGVCFDTTPFFGLPVNICLLTCEHLADCRWNESYTCYRAAPEDPLGVCLPNAVVVVIECETRGVCPESPKEGGGQ